MSGPGGISEPELLCLRGFRILNRVVADELRQLFRKLWDKKYPHDKWQDNQTSGETFVKNHKPSNISGQYDNKIKTGNLEAWDMTVLCRAFISYTLMNSIDSKYSDSVTILKDLRNTYAHMPGASRQRVDYTNDIAQIRMVFTELGLNEDKLTRAESIILSHTEIETLQKELMENQLTKDEFREYVQRQESFQQKVLKRLPVPGPSVSTQVQTDQGGFTQGGTDLEATEGGGQADQQYDLLPAWFRKSVPENRQRQKLNQKSLMMLVPFIGGNWEFVAMELDITPAQIEKFKKADPGSPDLQMMNVFVKWLQARGPEATLEAFVQVLWKCNDLCTVTWDGIEKILISGNNMD